MKTRMLAEVRPMKEILEVENKRLSKDIASIRERYED